MSDLQNLQGKKYGTFNPNPVLFPTGKPLGSPYLRSSRPFLISSMKKMNVGAGFVLKKKGVWGVCLVAPYLSMYR